MHTANKTIIRVRIEFEDGSYRELVGEDACKRWEAMTTAQAGVAAVHGMRFVDPLPWIEGTRHSENDE